MGGPLAALDINNKGNDVFDLYFFGNGENGLFGTTTGISWLDEPRKTTGNVKDSSTYYWSDDLKQAMLNAVNTWTSAIATPYDTEKHDRKLRIGFFLDDGSTAGGNMQIGMAGYAAYQTVSTNYEEKYGTSANSYTVAEWAWRDNNETDYLAPPSNMASGTYWETDVLSDEWNSIDIAIVLNPISTEYGFDAYGNYYYNQTDRTIEEMQNVATHEIGHGMGMNSKLYQAGGTLSGMVTTWDSLLTLDGANIVTVTNGQAEPTFETLTALHNAAWEVGEGKDPTKPGSYTGDEIQYDPDRRLSLNGEVGVHIAALLVEGDTLVHISLAEDGSNVLGPGGRMNSEFSESDLRALELLGWSVRRNDSIPEPTSGALCMLGLSALAMRRRRH